MSTTSSKQKSADAMTSHGSHELSSFGRGGRWMNSFFGSIRICFFFHADMPPVDHGDFHRFMGVGRQGKNHQIKWLEVVKIRLLEVRGWCRRRSYWPLSNFHTLPLTKGEFFYKNSFERYEVTQMKTTNKNPKIVIKKNIWKKCGPIVRQLGLCNMYPLDSPQLETWNAWCEFAAASFVAETPQRWSSKMTYLSRRVPKSDLLMACLPRLGFLGLHAPSWLGWMYTRMLKFGRC